MAFSINRDFHFLTQIGLDFFFFSTKLKAIEENEHSFYEMSAVFAE